MQEFKALGKKVEASRDLETIDTLSSCPDLGEVQLHCAEFTCRCPITNQPDWAIIDIYYGPDEKIVESKSVKMYLETWRDKGIFHEHLAQKILDDFVAVLEPLWLDVVVRFNTRGGIAITAYATHHREAWLMEKNNV